MRTRPADDATAIALAVALHAGLALLLWWAMRPPATQQASAGGIAAEVVDVGQLSAAMQRTLRQRPAPVEPEPEPVPEDVPEPVAAPPEPQPTPQAVLPKPAEVDQDEVVDAPTPQKATVDRPQEEKRRQQQVDLTRPAVAQTQAQSKQALEAQREAQIAEIRRKRAAASREALLAEQRLEQLMAARSGGAQASPRAEAAPGGAGQDNGLKGRYVAALQAAIESKWIRPDNIPSGAACRLVITQLPGGEVMDVDVSSPCVYDEAGQRSIEAAVRKAQPLPYAGFEPVFDRRLIITFRAP